MSFRRNAFRKPVVACRVHLNKDDSFDLFAWPGTHLCATDRQGFYHRPVSEIIASSQELGVRAFTNWQNGFGPSN